MLTLHKLLFMSITLFCVSNVETKYYKNNVTDFSQCQVYYSRSGSIYKDFFELTQHPQNGSLLDFHFSVMASSDAHILLAPSSTVDKGDPVYEIVIGAGGNTFSDIRRMQKSAVKATIRLKGLLSALDLQSFWIHVGEDGVIEVGKEGEELAFITWTDPDPLPLKVFSFSTWPGVEAKWYFDCPREDNTTHSKELEQPMTALEKLRRDLLFYYDPYVRPVAHAKNITVVTLQLLTNLVTLNEHKSFSHLSGTLQMSWQDEKINWNVSNYEGITNLHIFRREIWVPNLFLFKYLYYYIFFDDHLETAVDDGTNILEDTMLIVNSTGFVNWMTTINLISWCSPDDLGRWPRDEHSCQIILGFFNEFENLQLVFDAKNSSFDCPYSSIWQVIEVEWFANKGWDKRTAKYMNNFDPPGLTLQFKMKRTSNSYTTMLYTPFVVISMLLLITFWTSPFGPLKISLACLQLILSTLVLIGLGLIIPVHSKLVPNLVLLYSYCLIATLACVIIEVIVINLSRNEQKYPLPHAITKLLVSFSVKAFLCLPDIKAAEQYGNLNESLTKLNENEQAMWILLGIVIDRVAFFVYLGLIIYASLITY